MWFQTINYARIYAIMQKHSLNICHQTFRHLLHNMPPVIKPPTCGTGIYPL